MNLLDYFDQELALRAGTFLFSSAVGMIYAYYRKWSWSDNTKTFLQYILADRKAAGRAITTLLALCAGAGGLSYLDNLSMSQIIIAGIGIGLIVPERVEEGSHAAKNRKDSKS